jgi:biopolymer transport protein TolR
MTQRQEGLSAEPNLTPMIDVLLVVIIVFMVAVVRMYHTMDVVLPQACVGICEASAPIVLEVLPGPAYRINRSTVAQGDLFEELRKIYSARPEKIIQVAGHRAVPYSEVVAAMDIAKSAGVRVIAVAPRDLVGER